MSNRPYLQDRIDKLEAEFERHKADLAVVLALRAELDPRKTDRARLLRAVIDAHIRRMPGAVPAPSDAPRTPPTAPKPAAAAPPPSPPRVTTPPNNTRTPDPPEPVPPTTNRPDQLLDAWTALEVLSPFTYIRAEELAGGDRRNIFPVNSDSLPWLQGRKSRPKQRMYYQVVLGAIRMEPAVTRLLERYGDSRPEGPTARRGARAALAVVILDSKGVLVGSPAVAVSSFGWGVMTALTGRLADLAQWPAVEPTLADRLETLLRGPTAAGGDARSEPARPVDWSALTRGYEMLVGEFGLPDELIDPPTFAVCSYRYFQDRDPPEPLLLNSFFLGDLALARRLVDSGRVPLGLDLYLGRRPPPKHRDLLADEAALREAVSSRLTPPSRWPGPDRNPLCLMQQAAVNLAAHELKAGGLLGVNGPPGTGKTTLLRDVVAHVVAARAEVMCRFDDPQTAFTPSGERISAGGGAWFDLHRVCPDLRGYELLVASSNNRAVENVSGELPALGAVAADATGLRYFQALSDAAHGRPTWGMVAAVLGNSENRWRFRETFWRDEDVGMGGYLAAAAGTPRQIEERDPDTGAVRYRPPRIVAAEQPPTTRDQALARWRKARGQFVAALERSREWQRRLAALERDLADLPGRIDAEQTAVRKLAAATDIEAGCNERLSGARADAEIAGVALARATAARDDHARTRPGWLARLLGTAEARRWRESAEGLRAAVERCENTVATTRAALARRQADYERASAETRHWRGESETATAARSATQRRIETARRALGAPTADEVFRLPHAEKQVATPWFPAAAQRARDDVFQAALELHRAFIDAAAAPVRHNLGVLMGVLGGRRLRADTQEPLLGDLWSTLFLVVPLVSTTFASVERMLGRLPPESLGWLLVDEAGQALPQAAVGAILRSRRALVVGDPVQIEPVVTLPDQLTRAVSLRLGVDPDRYAAPVASVQTLADAASPYRSEFHTRSGSRTVGVPLLVHRRCSDPMFGIANAVAYAGLMVSATRPRPSPIRDVLGPSGWLHVEGAAEHHWCEEEGEVVLGLLRQLAAAGVGPDLYVVTPFVVVAERLRRLVRDSGVLDGWVPDERARDWPRERIGTVHTAQGREAEAVIFVLGAPSSAQTGARNWAGGRPNLLNVAVTRAKEALYVVGNRRLWREAGVFRELDARLAQFEEVARRREEERQRRVREVEAVERARREQDDRERAERMEEWKRSGMPLSWVLEYPDGWGQEEWAILIRGLRSSPYWPLNEVEVGSYLGLLREDLRAAQTRGRH